MASTLATRSGEPSAPGGSVAGLHALWRPGVGLAVWEDATRTGELPDPLRSLLAGKRFRRQIDIIDDAGRRDFVATMTLGTASAVSFLDATRSLPVAGDIAWYRHLVDGVRCFVGAGAVAPTLADIAGETVFRWAPLPTSAWRAWSAVVTGGAPGALADNGG
ncbi:hypothetical protein B1964_14845, partial [Gordonia sp. i37]